MKRLAAAAAVGAVVAAAAGTHAQAPIDAAFVRFFDAKNQAEAAAAADGIVRAAPDFDEAFRQLRRGRTYAPDAPKGVVRRSHELRGRTFPYSIEIPESYDASRRYQVRIQLHGGVARPLNLIRSSGSIGSLAGADQIYVLPTSWDGAPWWDDKQVENLRLILDALKRTYNVDENRVVVSGVSDGGTGAYYLAMRDTTPYASFLPLNGFIMVLANASLGLRDQLFPNNLRNKPLFVVNGGRDQLYPTRIVDPSVHHLQQGGVELTYLPQPEAVHNTAWWPEVKDPFERFVREHPRDPYPSTLTWEGEAGDRAHWLHIDRLAPPRADEPLPDLNDVAAGMAPNFGVRASGMQITAVMKGSNADRLGLLPGDVVEAINARVIPGGVPLLDLLETLDSGASVTFKISRGGAIVEKAGIYQPEMVRRVVALFPRPRPSGRVDLVRDGNSVRVTTRGVAAFTLLLSPDVFDFSKPVIVIADGRTVFEGLVKKDLDVLMRWAAHDNDRTMLFGAELPISVR
jgi:hypothetical protein